MCAARVRRLVAVLGVRVVSLPRNVIGKPRLLFFSRRHAQRGGVLERYLSEASLLETLPLEVLSGGRVFKVTSWWYVEIDDCVRARKVGGRRKRKR